MSDVPLTLRLRARALLIVGLVAVTTGCGASGASASNGMTMLAVSVGGAAPVNLAVDPFAAQLPQSVSFLAMSSDATVFLSFAKQVASASTMLTVGVAGGTATVWGKDATIDMPLTAMTGTVALDAFDLSSAGQFAIRIVDAEKPADGSSPSVRVDGSLSGSWDQIQ